MKRYGSVIRLRPDTVAEYRRLHAETWPGVLRMIAECNVRNYSIYLRTIDGVPTLFSYFEYVGSDFAGDMARMAADETTQRWWAVCKPLMEPLSDKTEDEFWAGMEEIFHCD